MIFIDKYISICYICISYLFMIYSDNRAHEQEAVHLVIFPGVASFFILFRCKTNNKERERKRKKRTKRKNK